MDLGEVIKRNIKSYARGHINTALPAIVTNVSNFESECTVDALPLVMRRYEDGRATEDPEVYSIPVVFPTGGGGTITFPIQVGDLVLLVFGMRSMEEYLTSDGEEPVIPLSARSHNLTDAIAIPGLGTYRNNVSPNPTDVEIKFKNMSMRMQENEDIVIENPTASVLIQDSGNIIVNNENATITMSPSGEVDVNNGSGNITLQSGGTVNINGATISTSGAIVSPTSVSAPSVVVNSKELNNHVHSGVTSGGANTGPNV